MSTYGLTEAEKKWATSVDDVDAMKTAHRVAVETGLPIKGYLLVLAVFKDSSCNVESHRAALRVSPNSPEGVGYGDTEEQAVTAALVDLDEKLEAQP